MSLTFIDTNKLPKKATAGQGEVTEVLNEALCGARNVQGSLRWLKSAETFKPDANPTSTSSSTSWKARAESGSTTGITTSKRVPASTSARPRPRPSRRRAERR